MARNDTLVWEQNGLQVRSGAGVVIVRVRDNMELQRFGSHSPESEAAAIERAKKLSADGVV